MTEVYESLWDCDRLAEYLGYAKSTVQAHAHREPDRLPPRVVHMKALRWVPSVCREWAERQPARKAGRPRLEA